MLVLVMCLYSLPDHYKVTRGFVAFARAIVLFTAGWAAYRLWSSPSTKRLPRGGTTLALSAAIVAIYGVPLLTGRDAWFAALFFPVVIYGLATGPSLAGRFLGWKPVHYLGKISFSVYLVHALTNPFATNVLHRLHLERHLWAWLMIVPAMTLPIAAISYELVEKRGRAALAELLTGRGSLGGRITS